MATSDLIQLGMLLIAALALLGSSTYFISGKIRSRFFGISVRLDFPDQPCVYIREGCYRRGASPVVRSVAIWCKITVANLLDEPLVLEQILASAEGTSPRSMIDPPVKTLALGREETVVAELIELPIRLEGRSVIPMWLLLEIPVPEPVGEAIYKMDRSKAKCMGWEAIYAIMDTIGGSIGSTSELHQILDKHPERAERADAALEVLLTFLQSYLQERIKTGDLRGVEKKRGIRLIPCGFKFGSGFTIRYPLIKISDGKATFTGDRHRLWATSSDLLNYLCDNAPTLLNWNPYSAYLIRILFSNGRVVSQKIPTGSDALWFQHPKRQGS